MKRFSFSLKKVLSLRKYEKEQKALEYQRVLDKYRKPLNELQSVKKAAKNLAQERDEVFKVQDYQSYLATSQRLSHIEEKERAIQSELSKSEDERKKSQFEYLNAKAKVDALENLESSQEKSYMRLQNKKELEELLEVYNAKTS